MEIKKTNEKIECEIMGCQNLADYCIENQAGSLFNMYLCKSCVKDLYTQFGKVLTPKSIKNVYQKGVKNELGSKQ